MTSEPPKRRARRLVQHLCAAASPPTHLEFTSASAASVTASLRAHGFCIVKDVLSRAAARETHAQITAALDRDGGTPRGRNAFEGFATRRLYALFRKTRCFDALALLPLTTGAVRAVLGEHVQLNSVVGSEIGPGERAQGLHRDDAKYPLPFTGVPEMIVNSMWALDDFTAANGATVVVPRTHKPHGADVMGEPVAAVMGAGSVMYYMGSVLHGGGANRSAASRLGVILEYSQAWLRPQETHTLAVPREVVRALPPPLQALLGYSVHPPFIGYVDGRHPRRLLEEGGGRGGREEGGVT